MIEPMQVAKNKSEPKNKKSKEIQVAEHIHSKDHVQMKGVSIGLFSPDRKERYCKSLEVGDGVVLSIRKQQQQQQQQQQHPLPPQSEFSSIRQEEHRPEKTREEGEDEVFQAEESRPFINLSPVRSMDEETSKSSSPVPSFIRPAVKHSSIEDALTIEANMTKESDQELQDEELLRSTSDLFCTRLDSESRRLHMILGIAALLDFLSFLSPSLLRREDAVEEESQGSTQYLYSYLFSKVGEHIDDDGPIRMVLPKPWFKRWILPGVAIQLLLNPRMIEISAATRALIRHAYHDVGPITAYRWLSALFIPGFVFISDRFNRHVWRRFVREENERSRMN